MSINCERSGVCPAHWRRPRVQSSTVSDPDRTAPSSHAISLAGQDLVSQEPPILRVDQVREVVVVLPRSRDPEREVFLDRCRAERIPVVVRPSGGGAVVLAPGVVAASLLVAKPPGDTFPERHFRRYCGAVAAALTRAGAREVAVRGVSDLALGDRKVAGSALRLWRGRTLFQISLLVDPDVELFERYLAMPSRVPDYRNGRRHRDFVTTLHAAGLDLSRSGAADLLGHALAPFAR